ncbi:tyrosine-type recombinase/integrase [Sporosarcina newyorkensis]|uniref:Integrase/recombinase XerD n=1 Tax=Sporosarcina newyorkensis TaxID=759851 RepID=A0A1T4XH29_9BACL|nr:tyrosine-type recombinase/integrase [Sporosarcina newyorkensis]SKA88789.1 integrase/recombinase XerD [Sporosarcina newyorkensis]
MRKFDFLNKKDSTIDRNFNFERTAVQFLDEKRLQKRSPKTIKTYKQVLDHFAEFCKERELQGIEATCVRDYVQYMTFEKVKWDDHPTNISEQVGVSARTVNNSIRILRVFYNWAVKKRLASYNPAHEVSTQKEDEHTFEIFTDEEVKILLNSPNQRTYTGFRDYVLMILVIDTGMRVTEMTSLKRFDISLIYRQIHIRAEIAKGRRARTIPISKTTSELLRKLFEYVGLDDENSEEYVFLSQYGDKYYGENFQKMLKLYEKRSGITFRGRVSPHTFRHYFAVKFLRNGGDAFALMKILGHTDISMTQRYVNYIQSDLQEVHDRVSPTESLLNPTKKSRGAVRFK